MMEFAQGLTSALQAVFWGLLLLLFCLFVHELAHYLAARWSGIRVTEFFMGMPCRYRLSWRDKKVGTEFGITPLLLGGYNRISGLVSLPEEHCDQVLAYLSEHGTASVAQIASGCGITPDEALDALTTLADWASVVPFYDPAKGEHPSQSTYPELWMSPARDANGLTVYDAGHDFSTEGSSAEGEPYALPCDPTSFLERERTHTFLGVSMPRRFAVVLAGVAANICCGLLLLTLIFSGIGMDVSVDKNVLGVVEQGSLAEQAGLQAGDEIVDINGTACASWTDVSAALDVVREGSRTAELSYLRDGVRHTVQMTLPQDAYYFGVSAPVERMRLPFVEGIKLSFSMAGQMVRTVARLFVPTQAIEVLDQSSSVVGVSVMAATAIQSGLTTYLYLMAAVSLSLGFMNLLPLAFLDGGKALFLLWEIISRKTVPLKVQNVLTYVSLAFLGFIFLYTLRGDIVRIMTGGI